MVRKILVGVIVALAYVIAYLIPVRPSKTLNLAGTALATTVSVQTRRGSLRLLPRTRLASYILRPDEHEPDMLDYIDSVPAGACFWDIGANVGLYSMYAALREGVRVVAFEPSAANFAALNRHIEINGMQERISALPIAFGARTMLDTLNMASSKEGSAFNQFGAEKDQFERPLDVTFRQGAVGFSIDDFMRIFQPPAPTHVKIDVDGLETDILRGGLNTFSTGSVQSMIVEVEHELNPKRREEILALMGDFGFVARPKASRELRNVVFEIRRPS